MTDLATSYSNVETASGFHGDFQQAKDYYVHALNIRLKNLGPEHVDVAASYSDLGNVYGAIGKFQQAKDYHSRALEIRLKNLVPEHVDVAASYSELGTVCVALGELQQAKDFHSRALDIRSKKLGPENDLVALSHSELGIVYSSLEDLVRAKDNFERARNILEKRSGPENIFVATCCKNLATICDVTDTPKQAKDWNERAQTILVKNIRSKRADVPVHSVPPYIMARGPIAKAAYQRALETGKTFDKRAKILLIGQDRVGKTSVARSLKGELFRQDESSTVGVQIDMPLKHVGEKPWKNSKEEQEKSTFHHKCALNISKLLLTEPPNHQPPNQIYVDSEVAKERETSETQRTEEVISEIGSNRGMYLKKKMLIWFLCC